MPTYEYHCGRCGPVEVFQSMRDDPLKKCPECGSTRFQRQISGGAGLIFKGSGFWETDYNRGADYQKAAKAESGTGEPDGQAAGGSASSTEGSAPKTDAVAPEKAAQAASPAAKSGSTKSDKKSSGGSGGSS